MEVIKDIIEIFFSIALFINALLFLPQLFRMYSEKSAKGVSLTTFAGFMLIQLFTVLHGLIVKDYILVGGYLFSMLLCGAVVFFILRYRRLNAGQEIKALELEQILDQLPGHVYWKDTRSVMVGCNEANWRDFGLKSKAEWVGKTDHDLIDKESADNFRRTDDEVIRTGKPVGREEIYTKPNGDKVLFYSQKGPIKNKQGEIIGLIGTSVDITRARKRIIDRLDMLEKVIAVMPGNVYWMDTDGVYLGCNDNEAKALGLDSPKEIIGKRNIDLPDFVVSDVLDKVNKQVIEKGETVIVEEPAIEKDGSQSTYLSHKSPLRDHSGTIIGLIGVSINITQRKKMEEAMNLAKEEAEIANETKSQFIENMEHDIRTPFVGVYGMIDVLAQQETDPSKKALFADIAMCAKELMNYCDSILDFSKVDSGLLPYTLKCFELRKVIDSVVAIQTLPAKTKGIDFKFSYDANLPRVVKGDQYRLNRTLINLVSNAVKFTSEGYVRLSVSLVRQDHEKREVVVNFLIEDTGMGIPEDKRAAVFERFVRLNASNKGRYKGQGLGLSIVNHFIDDMGGDIHVKSELGKGSSFIVCLPFKIPLTDEILDVE